MLGLGGLFIAATVFFVSGPSDGPEGTTTPQLTAFNQPEITEAPGLEHTVLAKATTSSFADRVLNSEVPVLVDFYADWCAVCRHQTPILTKFAQTTNTVRVVKVNTEENPELVAQYQIESLPTLLAFKHGDVVARYVGLAGEEQLKELLAD